MIDAHCHLESQDFEKDLDSVIKKCKDSGIKALVTSCAHPRDLERTLQIIKKYSGYVYASVGLHPSYIKEFDEKIIEKAIENIVKNSDKFVAIGEIGLDYWHVKEPEWQEKQRALFVKMIRLAKELKKPILIHSRNALEETLDILEKEEAKHVQLHMWGGHALMERVNKLGYYVSMNSIVMRSKNYRAVVKKIPTDKLMLETDSPWMALKKVDNGYEIDPDKRNDSTTIKIVAEKIAEIRNIPFESVWKTCGKNAINFFKLKV